MKAIDYNHAWSSNLSSEEEMAQLFGELLHETDTADAYEVAESKLFKKGRKYYWLQASGCSCWDGDYYGWELTLTELRKLARERAKDEDDYPGDSNHDKLMGIWVNENLN